MGDPMMIIVNASADILSWSFLSSWHCGFFRWQAEPILQLSYNLQDEFVQLSELKFTPTLVYNFLCFRVTNMAWDESHGNNNDEHMYVHNEFFLFPIHFMFLASHPRNKQQLQKMLNQLPFFAAAPFSWMSKKNTVFLQPTNQPTNKTKRTNQTIKHLP